GNPRSAVPNLRRRSFVRHDIGKLLGNRRFALRPFDCARSGATPNQLLKQPRGCKARGSGARVLASAGFAIRLRRSFQFNGLAPTTLRVSRRPEKRCIMIIRRPLALDAFILLAVPACATNPVAT